MSNEEKILAALESLGNTVATLVTKVDNIQTEVNDLRTEVKAEIRELRTEVNEVRQIVARIEVDHGKKITTIFDSYSGLYDISCDIRADIVKIKSYLEKHDFRIKWLEIDREASKTNDAAKRAFLEKL